MVKDSSGPDAEPESDEDWDPWESTLLSSSPELEGFDLGDTVWKYLTSLDSS